MAVYLDVPYCNQLRFPNSCSADNDPTGCWYACACMIGWYFEVGPRQGVPEIHSSRLPPTVQARLGFWGHMATGSPEAHAMMQAYGGGQSEHDLLARREHLTAIPHCADVNYNYSHDELEMLLRQYGPIFFYWQKTNNGQTYGHASVLMGVRDRSPDLIYHDPENAPHSEMDLSEFNTKRQRWQYALMRREGTPHQIRLVREYAD
jgi:Papain-like cysteine protease AvrRpt2